MASIQFFNEQIEFTLKNKIILREWLTRCASVEKKKIEALNYIFCSDTFLRKMNRQYLNHDYNTDVITFPSSATSSNFISGDIFLSIDRIRENAKDYQVKFSEELHRVMVHGLLHLCGYKDKSENEKFLMRKRENACLAKLRFPEK